MSCTIGISFIFLLRYVRAITLSFSNDLVHGVIIIPEVATKTFVWSLPVALSGTITTERYALPSPMTPVRKRSTPGHYPVKGKKGRCNYCHNTLHTRHESSIRCNRYDVALCIGACSSNSKAVLNFITLSKSYTHVY